MPIPSAAARARLHGNGCGRTAYPQTANREPLLTPSPSIQRKCPVRENACWITRKPFRLSDDLEMADSIDPRVDIGHVHLKVADLERAVAFYSGVLGFEVTTRMGQHAAFLGAGGYHHHIGLNAWESRNGQPPPAGSTGLFHVAIRYPD